MTQTAENCGEIVIKIAVEGYLEELLKGQPTDK